MRRWRWIGAAAGIGVGLGDIALSAALGVDFRLAGRDVTAWVAAYLCASYAALGYFIGALTELRKRDVELTAALGRSERLAMLGELSAALAHELRNPLAMLRSSLQNLSEAQPNAKERCLGLISEVDRMSGVIRGVLNLARPVEVTRTRAVEVGQLFERTRPLAEALLERRIGFDADGAHDAVIKGDAELLRQLLLGLLANAATYSPEEGSIRVHAARLPEAVEVAVEDRGPGVDAAMRERIFEPFVTTREEGVGLGLAVARRIVVAHRGQIRVEAREGGGARFVVRLPVEKNG
jgi:two-component system, NtrC family, sensor histidine kinase HydH